MPAAAAPTAPTAEAQGDITRHPLVQKTIELFKARVVSVQPRVRKES